LELAIGEKWCAAFLNLVGHKETFHGVGIQDIAEFASD
jgi:hypothetical protein